MQRLLADPRISESYLDLFKVAFSWGWIFTVKYLSEKVWKSILPCYRVLTALKSTVTTRNSHRQQQPLQTTSTAKNSRCKQQSLQRTLTGAGIVLLSLLSCLVLLVIFVLLLCGSFPCFSPWQILQQAVGQCLDKRLFRSRLDLVRISSRSRPDLV